MEQDITACGFVVSEFRCTYILLRSLFIPTQEDRFSYRVNDELSAGPAL